MDGNLFVGGVNMLEIWGMAVLILILIAAGVMLLSIVLGGWTWKD